MISQAGIYNLSLYENKDVVLTYSGDNITAISNSGDILTFNTDYNDPKFSNDLKEGNNNVVINDYTIEFHIETLDQSNFDTIESLQSSIYGWIPVIEFMDGQKYIINVEFKPEVGDLDSQNSHTFPIEMKPAIETIEELQPYTP